MKLHTGCQVLLLWATVLFTAIPVQELMAQDQRPSETPTFQATSNLVFLDVTVLDKAGHPVMKGLSKDDFIITEDKKPQPIFSFEAPETHVMGANAGDDDPDGNAPVTIFVLDLLNSNSQDFAFLRDSMRKFLAAQPAQLNSPAELMVVGNESLEMLQGYTRNKADLLYALDHLRPALPLKMQGSFYWTRVAQSIDALQQIALQNTGVPGRKNIVWLGPGGPGVNMEALTGPVVGDLQHYVHAATNMLVDARISLFVIYPGLKVKGNTVPLGAMDAGINIGDDDPFAGDVNFGVFVNETGGKLFYNRNDVDILIQQSQQLGSDYYTLTYQPREVNPDGKFRRVRVTLRNSNLRVLTKAGYFAPSTNEAVDPRQQTMIKLAEATRSTIPFTALDVNISDVVRHPDTHTADFVVQLKGKNLDWLATDDGKRTANLVLAAGSLTGDKKVLASKLEKVTISSTVQDPTRRAEEVARLSLTIPVPRNTKSVRVVVETEEGGRIGAADLDRKTIDAALAMPTPAPQLASRGPEYVPPTTPQTH
jgi:VWFA-related protein